MDSGKNARSMSMFTILTFISFHGPGNGTR